jgi:hypothetical protein
MSASRRGVLDGDETWSSDVDLDGDLVVPEGRRLTVEAGVRVGCARAPRRAASPPRPAFADRIEDFQSLSGRLIVAGELIARGTPSEPARFAGPGWGGLAAIGRGRIDLRRATLSGPAAALVALDFSRIVAADCAVAGAFVGAALGGGSRGIFRRCGFDAAQEAGVLAVDDARGLLRDCRFTGSAAGVVAAGHARLRLHDCRFANCSEAASARARGRLELDACVALGGDAAWIALDEASLRVRGSTSAGAKTGLWVLDRAEAECVDSRFEDGEFGLRASHRARLAARGSVTEGQSTGGVLIENEAFASLRGCADGSARGGPVLLDSARAELDGVRVRREGADG